MASTVYDTETITLQDETEVTLAPLAIGRLRRFMKAWSAFADIQSDDESFDIYVNCAGIALEKEKFVTEKFDKTRDEDKILTDEYREYLEDILDLDTIFKILEVCGGLKLNDPKLMEEIQKAQLAAVAAGQN